VAERRSETGLMASALTRRIVLVTCYAVAYTAPVAAFGASPDAAATGVPVVFDARVVGDDQRVRFVADVSAPVEIGVFTLADPYRIVVDLPEVRFALPESIGRTGRGLVSAFRYGLFSPGRSRIVIDLSVPVSVDKAFVTAQVAGQPARLVIDIVPTTRARFLADVSAHRDSVGVAADETVGSTSRSARAPRVVVIDPGHGGIDSGARGTAGALEKDVVLAFSRVLAEKLRQTGRYEVHETRTTDTFVSLGDRVAFARARDADLFLSIHANSFVGSSVRGAAVYTICEVSCDPEASRMAASENQSDILAGINVGGDDSDEVMDILLDLTRRETRNFAVVFARNLVEELQRTDTATFKDPHQEANFKVLEAPDVPSALIELGFISNALDEQHLMSQAWRAKTADSMVLAVEDYFAARTVGAAGQ
jgi:N-acetylmuramoyl-L-alanine amidase